MNPIQPDSLRKLRAWCLKPKASLRRLGRVLFFLGLTSLASAQTYPTTPYSFTTLAGESAVGSTDGPGNVARFNFPQAIVCDAAGNIYVADGSNYTIRKITPDGSVSTFAGKAGYSVESSNAANNGDGTGAGARLNTPLALAVDPAGNVYVAGMGNAPFRKITPAGVVTTIASGSPNGFSSPAGIAVVSPTLLYVSDTGNNTIRKITLAGNSTLSVTTLAGGTSGTADGSGSAAQFFSPQGLALDSAGTLYVADTGNHTIRKITPAGDVTTFAGTAGRRGHTDGIGTAAQFDSPTGLTLDAAGNLYVADYGNSTLRKISPSGVVTTVAGASGIPGHVDGNFPLARFFRPQGVAIDPAGNLLVVDSLDQTVRKISPALVVSTLAGFSPFQSKGSADGVGKEARFSGPQGLAVGPAGEVYVADQLNHTVRKITPNGTVTTLAGLAGVSGYLDGTGSSARFNAPVAVATDAAGNVYVADVGNYLIRKINPVGVVSTVAGRPGLVGPVDGPPGTALFGYMSGIAVHPNGNLLVSEQTSVRVVAPDGTISTLPSTFVQPHSFYGDVATDSAGNIYVLDVPYEDVVKITPAGTVTRIMPHLFQPSRFALDRSGNIFVTGRDEQWVWKLATDGTMTLIGGLFYVLGNSDGVGDEARFNNPSGIAVDAAGNVYVSCGASYTHNIRKGQPAGPPVITQQPQSQTVVAGGNVQFSVTATGIPDPTYQWYFNGTAFNGATSSTLTISNVRASDAGAYTVVVSNPIAAQTSSPATLAVTPAAGGSSPPSDGGGGSGGGAVSEWFIGALAILVIIRHAPHRGKHWGFIARP